MTPSVTVRPVCAVSRRPEAIFSDRKVLGAMGAARQFAKANGAVPQELMRVMKEGLGGHIKANAFEYHRLINRERARVARIKQLQARAPSASPARWSPSAHTHLRMHICPCACPCIW